MTPDPAGRAASGGSTPSDGSTAPGGATPSDGSAAPGGATGPCGSAPQVGPAPAGWSVRRLRGAAADLHAEPVPDEPVRTVWVLEATAPALVLGSTQSDDLVDLGAARAMGLDVVRRRSGGGAVLVDPAETAWVDVIVPAGDPLWDDDVGRAALWVGRAWRRALADLGVPGAEVHDGALACGPLGRLVCFGTVGAGEVTVPAAASAPTGPSDPSGPVAPSGTGTGSAEVTVPGAAAPPAPDAAATCGTAGAAVRKVVGVSQRRTRAAVRFQCAAYRRWDAGPVVAALGLGAAGERALRDAVLGTGRSPADIVDAFLRRLPA